MVVVISMSVLVSSISVFIVALLGMSIIAGYIECVNEYEERKKR